MKGAAPRAVPHYTSIARAQSFAAEVTKTPTPEGFRIGVGFEYLPMHKVASLPRSATAYRRGPTPNFIIMIAWINDSKDSVDKARKYANDIVEILLGPRAEKEESIGYANYGASVLLIAPVASEVTSSRMFRSGWGGSRCSRDQVGEIQAGVCRELSKASGDQEAL